jgi:UDP-perosamine 4-acetyltransferase
VSEGLSYIIGSGGHARVIASLLTGEVALVAENPEDGQISQAEFFAETERFSGSSVYIGIGANERRRAMFDRLKAANIRVAICIAPNAFVARDAQIGEGAVICAGAVIGSRAYVGQNTIVNTLSSVDHDCILGDDTQITAGVTLGGSVKVGSNCFFGIKSAVIPGVSIGRDVDVMAGALVARSLPDGVVVGGIPARVISSRGSPDYTSR